MSALSKMDELDDLARHVLVVLDPRMLVVFKLGEILA